MWRNAFDLWTFVKVSMFISEEYIDGGTQNAPRILMGEKLYNGSQTLVPQDDKLEAVL